MSAPCVACRGSKVETAGQICAKCVRAGREPQRADGTQVAKSADPYEELEQILALLKAERERLVREAEGGIVAGAEFSHNKQIATLAKEIANVAKVMGAFRKASADDWSRAPREEQIATIVKWFSRLPAEYQRHMIHEITQQHNARRVS